MWQYVVRKLLWNIPVYLGILLVVMLALRVNDPVWARLGKNATQEQYEQVKRDPSSAIRKLASFMQVDLAAAELEEVARRSSFAYMKQMEHKFNPGQVVPWGQAGGYMLRRGERGSAGTAVPR